MPPNTTDDTSTPRKEPRRTFEPTKRRADTMNLVGERLVAWSTTLPSPRCWALVGAATPSWRSAAITHLDEYQAAGMLEPTTTQVRADERADDFVLVATSGLGRAQCKQWRQAVRDPAEHTEAGDQCEQDDVGDRPAGPGRVRP